MAIVYNPVARTLARRPNLIPRVASELKRQGMDVRLVPTFAQGSATEQVRSQIADGCQLIVAAGGDGTINEVADGMLFTGVPLAIVPGGTANVLARELRLPTNPERAVAMIGRLEAHQIATGAVTVGNHRRSFICMAGIGLDAQIISRLNLGFKAMAGKAAYYLGGFSQILRTLPEFDVSVDDRAYRASFALVSRVRNYGGDLEIARKASLLREDFEVVLFSGTRALQYLPYFAGVLSGRVTRIPGVISTRGRTVSCRHLLGEPVYVQVDGELAGQLPTTVDMVPDALTLLTPAGFAKRESALTAVPAFA